MMFWLFILVLSLHLACMNVAAAAPVVSAWLEWRERRGEAIVTAAADYLATVALYALLAGAVLGLALIGLRWSPRFVEVWSGPLSRKALWGVAELVFSLLLAVIYLVWRRAARQPGTAARVGRLLVALLSGTNLLYHFPPLFSAARHLLERNLESGPAITAAEFRSLMFADANPAMNVHVVLASFAAVGIALLGLTLRWQRQGRSTEEVNALGAGAARLALTPSLLQVLVGLWLLVKIDLDVQGQLLGGNPLAGICFVGGVLAALWLMQQLATIAFGDARRIAMLKSMGAFLLTVFLMTAAWHLARAT